MKSGLLISVIFALAQMASAQTLQLTGTEDIGKLIEIYSQASGQKFVLDPGVRGRVTILNKEPISFDEAFHQISLGLAIHGYAVVKNGDVMVVRPARAAQRDLVEISTELPALKPERLATWIVTLRHGTADSVMREFRNVTTKDGDISSVERTNQILITDYTSNLHRFAQIIKTVDRPTDPSLEKHVAKSRKEREGRQK